MGAIATYLVFAISVVMGAFAPFIGVLGYVWFVSFVPQFLWRFSLANPLFDFQKYIAISTLAGFLLSGFRGAVFSRSAIYATFGFLGYLLLSFLSTLYSVEPARSWFFIEQFSKIALMTLVLTKLLDSEKRIQIAIWVILCGLGWNAFEINRDYYSRGISTVNQDGWAMQNANGYALLLVMVAVISLSMFISIQTRTLKAALFLICILSVHAIYLVESRGGMLGLIVGSIILFAFQRKTSNNMIAFCAVGAVALILAGPPVVKEFFSSFDERETLDTSASDRFMIWTGGLRLTLDNPLLGVGPWAAELPMAQYAPETGVAKYQGRVHLHNLPLEISTGSGIPAMLCYIAFFFSPVYYLSKQVSLLNPGWQHGLTCGIVSAVPAYWFSSLFNSGALLEIPYMIMAIAISLQANIEQGLNSHAQILHEES